MRRFNQYTPQEIVDADWRELSPEELILSPDPDESLVIDPPDQDILPWEVMPSEDELLDDPEPETATWLGIAGEEEPWQAATDILTAEMTYIERTTAFKNEALAPLMNIAQGHDQKSLLGRLIASWRRE